MTANPTTTPAGGLFEQLAEHQLAPNRTPQGLRPQLPYWFEEAPTRFGAEGELDVPSTRNAASHPVQDPARRAEHESPRIIAAESLLAPTGPAPRNRASETGTSPPQRPMNPMTTEPIRATAPPPNDRTEPDLRQPSASPVMRSESHTDRPHTPERLIPVESAVARPAAELPPPAVAPKSAAAPTFEPPRLMPRLPTPAAILPPAQSREASEPTIEIHIGRVEVRAQVAPPTTAPAQRPAPPDQRLAAYLRNRGNGARS